MWLRLLPLVGLIDRFSQQTFRRLSAFVLRRAGVTLEGSPLWISPRVYLDVSFPGSISVGDRAVISHFCRILTHDFSLDRAAEALGESAEHNHEYYRTAPVSIGARSFIGLGVTILPGVNIGEGAIVGSGSVVTRDVEAHAIVAGNPARHVGTIEDFFGRRKADYRIQRRRR